VGEVVLGIGTTYEAALEHLPLGLSFAAWRAA
jgi:hypothetical protein